MKMAECIIKKEDLINQKLPSTYLQRRKRRQRAEIWKSKDLQRKTYIRSVKTASAVI